MKITKIVVTDEDGNEHPYVGEGFISPVRTQTGVKPGKPEPTQVGIDAHLVWTPAQ